MPALALPTHVLDAGDVDIWRVPIDPWASVNATSLSPAEVERLGRHRGEARRRFAVSHDALHRILAGYFDCRPEGVPLSAPYGQPPCAPGLELSLAHGDGMALVAVAGTPVGVDVEATDNTDDDLHEVAESTLCQTELAAFWATPAAARPRSWLRSWVRKEAVLKARGEGLADRLVSEIDVSEDSHCGISIVDVDAGPRHLGAMAVAHRTPRVTMREFGDVTV